MVDCNNCKNLNMTEKEQLDKRRYHICLKYNKRVFHNTSNPKHKSTLYPCGDCRCDNYESYETID